MYIEDPSNGFPLPTTIMNDGRFADPALHGLRDEYHQFALGVQNAVEQKELLEAQQDDMEEPPEYIPGQYAPVTKEGLSAAFARMYTNTFKRPEEITLQIGQWINQGWISEDDHTSWIDGLRNRTVNSDFLAASDFIEGLYGERIKAADGDEAEISRLEVQKQQDLARYYQYISDTPDAQEKIGENGAMATQIARNIMADIIALSVDSENAMDEIRPDTRTRSRRNGGGQTLFSRADSAGLTDAEILQQMVDNSELYGKEHEYVSQLKELEQGYGQLIQEQFGINPATLAGSRIESGGRVVYYGNTVARDDYAVQPTDGGWPLYRAVSFMINPNTNDIEPVLWNERLQDWEPVGWDRAKQILGDR